MNRETLLRDPRVIAWLTENAPLSTFTGRRLTLVDHTTREGLYPNEKLVPPTRWQWENCEEPYWWHGANTGIYHSQIRQPVGPDDIRKACAEIGIPDVEPILTAWAEELTTNAHMLKAQDTLLQIAAAKAELAYVRENQAKDPRWGSIKYGPKWAAAKEAWIERLSQVGAE